MSKLLPGENLILKDHPHWITVAGTLVFPVVLLLLVGILDFTLLSPNIQAGIYVPHLRTILSLAVIAFSLIWLVIVWITWQSIVYTLTDQRITIESGVLSRQEKIIPIDRVQDCTTRQSIFGRILNYGRVEIDAAGAQGAEVLANLPNPAKFRDEVFVLSEKRRGGAATPSAPMPSNPSGI
ncbi:MAG TPA: PH domain-containing protein [Candidatus Dormibacteraeota bacterium]|jgi:uncharacterized membrane protein YdbT with pleckstrin-like domain|nr:PH domain-containing protein [Candidatus Dormibacteraeota bacterium]